MSRVGATIHEDHVVVVDVTREVLLDRERPVRRGHQEYILVDLWNDFPDQIELLSEGEQEVGTEHSPDVPSQDAPREMAIPAAEDAREEAQEKPAPEP